MLKSWMVIGGVTFLIAFASSILRPKDVKWFARLQRPRWLTFEALIPIIWTIILICGAWSAYMVWERDPGSDKTWFLMGAYALLEVAIVLYSPATLWLRSLKAGTIVGGVGVVIGLLLTLAVWQVSGWAALLLVPYLLWGPIGTYTTWAMDKLNPESA
ncbi:MAG: tryptophan-rich sensory protein [Tildeniella nuda ZEHNDER 1965/U140]|jgi:tryptophan-rich sensory protein|nr:tryptophan-rich sensory protein [Tildeniella nuda ZEHNDER 1965/U140]